MKIQDVLNKHEYLQLNIKTGIAVSGILWLYLILRAYFVPMLHDEIATFWIYINPGNYLPYTYRIDSGAANNHVLNSLLTRFFYLISGHSPLVLRLANLVFVPVYCWYAFKIADVLKNKYLALLFWLCLLSIYPIVEFLALSRGYGMSFALLLGCLWYLIKVMQTNKAVDYFLTLLFLTAAVSANLSLLSTDLIIIFLLLVNVLINNTNHLQKIIRLGILFISGIIPLVFFAVFSFALQKEGALYYGQPDSFWGQSVNTLLYAFFENQGRLLRLVVFIYFVIILLMFVKYLSRHFSFSTARHIVLVFPLLLIGNIFAVLLLNYLFHVNFPEDRSGFYFYYFFAGSLFFLTDQFAENKISQKIAWIALPFLYIPLHFIFTLNLLQVAVYKEDRVPYRFYEEIRMKSESMSEVATIGSYKGRILVLAFHNYLDKGNVAISHVSDYPSLVPDLQVIKSRELAGWNLYYNAIDFDKASGYHLLERKHKLKRNTIAETDSISTNGFISDEYFNLAKGTIDTLLGKPLFYEYTMDIESPAEPFIACIVVGVADSVNNATAYETIPLNWIKPAWNIESKHYHNGQLVTNLKATSKTYITYFWNINKVPFSISNAKVTIKQLEKDY